MTYLRIGLGLAISVACIVAVVSRVDLQVTWGVLTHAQPLWLGAALLMVLAAWGLKSRRWGLLYYPVVGLRFRHLVSAMLIGYLASSILPLRLGELVRVYLIGRTEPVTFTRSLGT